MVAVAAPGSTSGRDWQEYYRRTRDRPPRATTVFALEAFAREGRQALHCVDLGCGAGRDARILLAAGHRVLAVDRSAEAEAALAALPVALRRRLAFRRADLADFTPPPCDLVNASFVLFTLDAVAFARLWARIRDALRPGGRFAGHLLGPADDWARAGRCPWVDRAVLERLVAGYAVEYLDEERCRSVTPRGLRKRWHVWHLVLRREPARPPRPHSRSGP